MFISRLGVLAAALTAASAASTPPRAHQLNEAYTFSEYLNHFSKSYSDPEEYARRSQIFYSNLKKILAHNEGRLDAAGKVKEGYVMGVNRFTDQAAHEIPMGYNKAHKAWRGNLEEGGVVTAMERRLDGTASYSVPADIELDEVSDLPDSVDWRDKINAAPNQGGCGDCWAFAATACIESHLAISKNEDVMKLSEVNMFQCSPNPQECGGTGQCEGSTPELGWNYIADLTAKNEGGMYADQALPFESYDRKCEDIPTDDLIPAVGIDGWTLLPSNDYKTTMNALAKVGPLSLAVAAGEWAYYESGVFSSDQSEVNHAVVLAGYGIDENTGEKYYLIRNSWGLSFGEWGYIRIKRSDDDDNNCKMDTDPLVGITCALDANGNKKTDIPAEKVCGDSAVLYDVSYPVGVHRLKYNPN